MKNLVRAFRFFRPDQYRLLLILGVLVAALALNVLKPWPLAVIVDSILGDQPLPAWLANNLGQQSASAQILLLVTAMFLLFAGQTVLASWSSYFSINVGLRGLTRVRNEVFGYLQRLSLRFHHGSRTGDLIYRAATDTYAFQTLFQHGLFAFASSLLSLLFIVAVMWQMNRPLTLLTLAVVPLLVVTIKHFGHRMHQLGLRAQKAESSVTSLIQQGILALPLTQSYTRETEEQQRFTSETARAREQKLSQHGSEILYSLMVSLGLALGTAGITWLGAHQVLQGNLSLGELLVFLAYLTQMFEPLNQLSYVGSTVASALAGIDRVFEILDTPEEVRDRPDARPIITPTENAPPASNPKNALILQGQVTLDRVCFGYKSDQPILREISFALRAGESAAIIGPSGAGKTTLLNLLPRFFDPVSGSVFLDGVDLRDLQLKALRSRIGLVLQEPILLPGSLAENISCGNGSATLEEIRAAAQAANADRFIEKLPQQYDTQVGEGATQLSVGEKQRINLARAFLKNAPILLLDEPTSSLDAESEALIVESISRLMKDRTTLIVAHRLTTIANVDRILVIEEGRLTQFGSPAQLETQPGYYQRLLRGTAGVME